MSNEKSALSNFLQHISFCDSHTAAFFSHIYNETQENILDIVTEEKYISIIIICRNEERCIKRCLDSIIIEVEKNDEILLIDTGSTDETLNIVNKYKEVDTLSVDWEDDFSKIRNLGISKAKNDWIFFIDADEQIEKYSLGILKDYIKIMSILHIEDIVCSPRIIDDTGNEYRGVKRILNKKTDALFYGKVHEEIRKDKQKFGRDIHTISFDNIILYHDGYKKEIIKNKNKVERNIYLLKEMLKEEPEHPRWLYFYCRDGAQTISEKKKIEYLKRIIQLSIDESYFYYKVRALSELIGIYFTQNNLIKAQEYLSDLKKNCPNLSDVIYWDIEIKLAQIKTATQGLLIQIIEYQQEHRNIEYGSMNPYYYHLDYLCAICFFEIGEYDKCFNILRKLKQFGYNTFNDNIIRLKKSIESYFGDNG